MTNIFSTGKGGESFSKKWSKFEILKPGFLSKKCRVQKRTGFSDLFPTPLNMSNHWTKGIATAVDLLFNSELIGCYVEQFQKLIVVCGSLFRREKNRSSRTDCKESLEMRANGFE